MSENPTQDNVQFNQRYKNYIRQKCFVAFTKRATWSDDLLSACDELLNLPEFNLEPDYAGKHFEPDISLRDKTLELIANARYGIYDLSFYQDSQGNWQIPRNVFIELGIAIACNRPTLLLRHTSNHRLALPECLKGIEGNILEFSGETSLKHALMKHLPNWVETAPDRDWWNRYCNFGNRRCEYRQANPRGQSWGNQVLRCYIADGPDLDRDDFRSVLESVIGRFSETEIVYLNEWPTSKGYEFLLCTYCQATRSTPLAIYRITSESPAETFIMIGISIAIEKQFGYKIPKILIVERIEDIPSLLAGYEALVARNEKELKSQLRTFLPRVIQKVREKSWKPKPLPFTDIQPVIEVEPIARTHHKLSISQLFAGKYAPLRVYYFDPPPLSEQGERQLAGAASLAEALDRFIATHESGYFRFIGDPGTGKTASLAQLAHNRNYLHHFVSEENHTASTPAALKNLCVQVITRYDLGYTELSRGIEYNSSALVDLLSEATQKLNSTEQIVIIVDAIDKADVTADGINPLGLPSDLPSQVYFVVSQSAASISLHINVPSFDFKINKELPRLELFALGAPRVLLDGKPIETKAWQTATTKELFFFFASQRQGWRKEEVVQFLWGNAAPGQASDLFHSSIYRIRRALFAECLVYQNGVYQMNPDVEVWLDFEEFENSLDAATKIESIRTRIVTLEHAINLYKGDFLNDVYSDWCVGRRQQLHNQYLATMLILAGLWFQSANSTRALELYHQIISVDPFSEVAYRGLIEVYIALGNRIAAIQAYQQCIEKLERGFGIKPMPETTALYNRLVENQ